MRACRPRLAGLVAVILAAASLLLFGAEGNAPFLLYLYYAFDNRPAWFRALWMLGSSSAFDLEDGPLRFLILLAAVSIAVSLPLLFLDVAF